MPAASSKNQKNFDYGSLDADTYQFVQQQTAEINVLMRQTAQGIVAIGFKLLEVKAKLRHGQFGDWLAAEFEWSQDTATNFMRVAQRFGNNPKVSEFAPTALYLLAAPSTPELARQEALARAEAGEKVTYKAAKSLKQKYVSTPQKTNLTPEKELEQLPPHSLASELEIPRAQDKRSKPEIVAFIPRTQASMNSQVVKVPLLSQPSLQASVSDAATWWALDGKHLLFCGDPNSNDFLQKIPTQVSLLLAFPTPLVCQHSILAVTSFIVCEQQLDKVMKEKKAQDIYTLLETMILDYSEIRSQIVICFLPSSVSSIILNTTNCLERRAIIAEPNRDRCRAAIDYWKKSGGKVERLNSSEI